MIPSWFLILYIFTFLLLIVIFKLFFKRPKIDTRDLVSMIARSNEVEIGSVVFNRRRHRPGWVCSTGHIYTDDEVMERVVSRPQDVKIGPITQ